MDKARKEGEEGGGSDQEGEGTGQPKEVQVHGRDTVRRKMSSGSEAFLMGMGEEELGLIDVGNEGRW